MAEDIVIRVDGYFLFSVGAALRPLSAVQPQQKFQEIQLTLLIARGALDNFLNKSVFRPRTSFQKGVALLSLLMEMTEREGDAEVSPFDAYRIRQGLQEFETVLAAELGIADLYLVSKQRGYDTTELIERAAVLFPDELSRKVPEAIADLNQAGRCIAFQLPTAAGFHLHRANESVLHRYYDAVTSGKARPSGRNIGDYLTELNKQGAGDPKVRSALRDLKDLHRNPLIHPEDSLESVDEAIALLGGIHSVVVHMLKAIPEPPTSPS